VLAAALVVSLTALLLVLPIVVYGTLLSKQAIAIFEWVKPQLHPSELRGLVEESLIGQIKQRAPWLPIDDEALSGFLSTALSRLVEAANVVAQAALGGLVSFLFNLFLFLFMLFFLLRDGERLVAELRRISPLGVEREGEIARHLGRTIQGILAAQLLVPFAQGLVALPGFALVGLPSPLLWSAMVALISFVPLIGAPLVWVPASIYVMKEVSLGAGIACFLYGLLFISTIDNLLKPLVLRGAAQIHPVLGFLAILGGVMTFGAAGFLVGPVILSLVLSALRIYRLEVWQETAPAAAVRSPDDASAAGSG
jgi:predicted PurR-regulated permease PerM